MIPGNLPVQSWGKPIYKCKPCNDKVWATMYKCSLQESSQHLRLSNHLLQSDFKGSISPTSQATKCGERFTVTSPANRSTCPYNGAGECNLMFPASAPYIHLIGQRIQRHLASAGTSKTPGGLNDPSWWTAGSDEYASRSAGSSAVRHGQCELSVVSQYDSLPLRALSADSSRTP